MLEQTFTAAQPMPCSITSYGDERTRPLPCSTSTESITIAAFGMEEISVDYFIDVDGDLIVEGVTCDRLDILPLLNALYAKHHWSDEKPVDATDVLAGLVRKALEDEF